MDDLTSDKGCSRECSPTTIEDCHILTALTLDREWAQSDEMKSLNHLFPPPSDDAEDKSASAL